MSITSQDNSFLSDAPMGEVTVTGDTLQVVFDRHYRFPIEKVWAAITIPERLADWFVGAEIKDLRVGGEIIFNGTRLSDTAMKITVCEPPRAFAWTWALAGKVTLVRFDLSPENGGCRLTLTHSGVPLSAGGVRPGWHAHLEALPDAVEGVATPVEVKIARETALKAKYPPLPQ
jgi:uncharacterized protein YndB with AHSA1/START domain